MAYRYRARCMYFGKKPTTKPTHPPTATMVNAAIAALMDKKGSSLHAIKKYIASNYIVQVNKQTPSIKKYLKSAVEKKTIIQTKGVGATGRFKSAAPKTEVSKVKNAKSATRANPKTPKSRKSEIQTSDNTRNKNI